MRILRLGTVGTILAALALPAVLAASSARAYELPL